MAIKANHQGLQSVVDGRRPDADDWFVDALIAGMYEDWQVHDVPVAIEGRRFRASSAGRCTRALAYGFAGVEYSDPPTPVEAANMHVGTLLHDAMDTIVRRKFPHAEVEIAVDLQPLVDGAARMDVIFTTPRAECSPAQLEDLEPDEDAHVHLVELKTVNGYKFKAQAIDFDGPPEGPQVSAVLQVAVAGAARRAHRVTVCSLAREVVSKKVANGRARLSDNGRMGAQWTFDRSEFLPLADGEIGRINWLLTKYDATVVKATAEGMDEADARRYAASRVPRFVEVELGTLVRITNPTSGAWEQQLTDGTVASSGTTWHCAYCDYRSVCEGDGA